MMQRRPRETAMEDLEEAKASSDGRADAGAKPGRRAGARQAQPTPRQRARIPARRVLALLRPYAGRLVAAGLLLIGTNGLGLIFPLVIRSLLNTILLQRDARLLNLVVEGLVVLFLVQAAVGAVQGYLVT